MNLYVEQAMKRYSSYYSYYQWGKEKGNVPVMNDAMETMEEIEQDLKSKGYELTMVLVKPTHH